MRAPPTPQEDLVRSIADELKPWKCSEGHILEQVRGKIDVVRAIIANPPSFGLSNENKEYAKKILDLSTQLQKMLQSMPQGTLHTLFAYPPNPFIQEEESLAEMFTLARALGRLCRQCEGIIENGAGDDPRFGREQHLAAVGARELMVELSEKEPTTGENSSFCMIASHLYEAATGKREADLRRACKAVRKHFETERIKP
jgi:hypothetical protein